MSILINFKMCDNSKECNGVTVCPTGALSYNNEKKTLVIDNSKCISCGKCEEACPIGAISVAKTEEEYETKQKEIDNDPRTIKELFVNRYGSVPVSNLHLISYEGLKDQLKVDDFIFVEVFKGNSIKCLIKSIPVKEILNELKEMSLYYKLESNDVIEKEYEIKDYPSLLIFRNGKLTGKIDGYYSRNEKKQFIKEIKKILQKYRITKIFKK